jgi:hypothetical protein
MNHVAPCNIRQLYTKAAQECAHSMRLRAGGGFLKFGHVFSRGIK